MKRNDAEMMKKQSDWPRWPILPIKRPADKFGAWPECAVILASRPTRVVLKGMYDLPQTAAEVDALPHKDYASIEEIVADGWLVD